MCLGSKITFVRKTTKHILNEVAAEIVHLYLTIWEIPELVQIS